MPVLESFSRLYGLAMRRVIAIENTDRSLERFSSGKVITFKTISAASPWRQPGQRLKPIDVPDDHTDALTSAGPVIRHG